MSYQTLRELTGTLAPYQDYYVQTIYLESKQDDEEETSIHINLQSPSTISHKESILGEKE